MKYNTCKESRASSSFYLFYTYVMLHSGRVHRRFVPISKILKPVMNECVTPVTCYWSLALLLRDEDETMLVFQKLHPLVKLLLPICKALRAFTNSGIISPSVVL